MSELESKQTLPRSEIATYLHEFADELDNAAVIDDATGRRTTATDTTTDANPGTERTSDDVIESNESETDDPSAVPTEETQTMRPADRVTLVVGDNSATVNPSETPEFEIEVDSDSSLVGASEKQSVSFELEWTVENPDDESAIEIK